VNVLLHPARVLSRTQALIGGGLVLVIVAALASVGGLITDGVLNLDYHALNSLSETTENSGLKHLAQGLANVVWMALALLVASHVIKAPVAWLDWLAHVSFARWPLVGVSAYLALPGVSETIIELSTRLSALDVNDGNHVMAPATHLLPAMELMLWSLPSLLGLAWMIWLLFDAYRHLTQTRSIQTTVSFGVALVVAQGLSQLTIF